MNVVRQMRMKNLLSYEKLLAVPRLTTPDSMSITLYNSKIDFQDFLRPLLHKRESRMGKNSENCL